MLEAEDVDLVLSVKGHPDEEEVEEEEDVADFFFFKDGKYDDDDDFSLLISGVYCTSQGRSYDMVLSSVFVK